MGRARSRGVAAGMDGAHHRAATQPPDRVADDRGLDAGAVGHDLARGDRSAADAPTSICEPARAAGSDGTGPAAAAGRWPDRGADADSAAAVPVPGRRGRAPAGAQRTVLALTMPSPLPRIAGLCWPGPTAARPQK